MHTDRSHTLHGTNQSCAQPRLVMLERPPGGATIRWPDRRGMLSSACAPKAEMDRNMSHLYQHSGWSLVIDAKVPERLKLDWCRLRIGGGWVEVGEVLADGAGVMYLGVGTTSHTGPSYIPRVTPCWVLTWTENTSRHNIKEVRVQSSVWLYNMNTNTNKQTLTSLKSLI